VRKKRHLFSDEEHGSGSQAPEGYPCPQDEKHLGSFGGPHGVRSGEDVVRLDTLKCGTQSRCMEN
jgi:hypothetical protein